MKTLTLLLLPAICIACSPSSPYDVSPNQVKQHVVKAGGPVDLDHLPPGAVKHDRVFNKGDKLPDGSIAPGKVHLVTVDMNH